MGNARIILAAVAILLCAALALSAARHGLARYAYESRGAHPAVADFEQAIRLDNSDPEPELRLADALSNANRNPEAIKHCERAVSLRPNDQFSWLELGYLRKLQGDLDGACQADAQAVALAPFYGQPHWKLGKCLLDADRREEGFRELRTAAKRRPSYFGEFIQLVLDTTGGDLKSMQDAIRPSDPASNLAVARFLGGQKRWEDALHFYKEGGAASAGDLHGMMRNFIETNRYLDAYQVWKTNHESAECSGERDCIHDAGFETTSELEDAGFGWCVPKPMDSVRVGIDEGVSSSGKRSLRIRFQGDSDPAAQLVTQLVLVRPSSRYRLTFKARTTEIKSIALPVVSVIDTGLGSKAAESAALPLGTTEWQGFTMEFTTSDHTDAVLLVLSRAACKYSDCPIFGTLWLDDFALEKG